MRRDDVRRRRYGTGDGPNISVSGSRQNENLFLFDGAEFNAGFPQYRTELSATILDALQEGVKVLTNSFSAKYGRNARLGFQRRI